MTIDALPTPGPDRTQTQAAFDASVAALMTAWPTFITQANALAAAMNAIAAGTAFAIPYTFSTTTADADPGAGLLRLDQATQNTATAIRVDLLGSDTGDYTDLIDSFDASTSTVKGNIRLVKLADPTKWIDFDITAVGAESGYRNLTVSVVDSSAASPFTDANELLLLFTRTGDKGDTGTAATQTEMEAASSNTVFATPSNMKWHPGIAKAWLKCDAAGAIQVSHNITSITDNGTGDVTVTIATDFSSADFAPVATPISGGATFVHINPSGLAAGSFNALCRNDAGSATDPSNWSFVCFGDQ